MSEQEDSSGSDSDDEIMPLLHAQQEMMLAMLEEVDCSLEDLRQISHDIHHSQDLFTHLHLQETLQPLLQRWSSEKRITEDGLHVTLTEEEQKEFGLPLATITIYEVCAFFVQKKTTPKIESHLSAKQ
jgi:hypothetical protein